ncbi:MAG: DegV family protein [Eubacteriales bacterium]|nr:DegV family protein [Eubacteriales bacterium]
MKKKLVADSSANLISLEGIEISYAAMKVCAGQEEYTDTPELDVQQMMQGLSSYKGKSSSACPSVDEWLEAFGDADEVYAVSITSNLSGAYNSACVAAEQYEAAHPGRRVFVLDSLSTGPEMELILEKYHELIANGLDFAQIKQRIQEYIKRTHLWFSLESLATLAKNGRVSPAVAKIAGLLGIRIVGRASAEGTLEPLHKARGEQKALKQLFESMKEMGYRGGKVRLSHTFNEAGAAKLKEMIESLFPAADIKIRVNGGLCSYYSEMGGILVGFES